MQIGHFVWMNTHSGKYNLCSSAVTPFDLGELIGEASDVLEKLAEIYGVTKEEITLTHGTQEANFLAFASISNKVSKAQGFLPEYEPIRALPSVFGKSWDPIKGIDELDRGSVLLISNPNNPTGNFIDSKQLKELSAELVSKKSYAIIDSIFSEFVGLDMDLPLDNIIITSSTSKFYTMKGVKLGWIIANKSSIKEIAGYADLISPGPFDLEQKYTSIILGEKNKVRERNSGIISPNANYLLGKDWGNYVKGMPIAFIGTSCSEEGINLSEKLLKMGVVTIPGKYFGVERGLRIGLGSISNENFKHAIEVMSEIMYQCKTR